MNRAKTLILSVALAVLAAISLAAARPASAQLIYATDFNSLLAGSQITSGELSGLPWNVGSIGSPSNTPEGWDGSQSGVETAVHDGTQYAYMQASPVGGGTLVGPTFTAVAGVTYTVTAYMANVAPAAGAVIPDLTDLSIVSGPGYVYDTSTGPIGGIVTVPVLADIPTTTFTPASLTWTATSSGPWTFYLSNTGTGQTLLSYISVTGAPEASTVIGLGAMLALGCLFLLAPRKRVSKLAA
jgi:hypothetical protein